MPESSHEDLHLPRGLLLAGAVWLLTGWLLTVGVTPQVLPTAASYSPAVRWMVVHVGLGVLVAWPMMRLSGRWSGPPAVVVILDLLVLVSLTHVVVWPLRLITGWPPIRVLAISTHLSASTVLVGGIVALGIGLSASGRVAAMALCLGFAAMGPAVAAFSPGVLPQWVGRFSPLLRLWRLMGLDDGRLLNGLWIDSVAAALAGVLALIASRLLAGRTCRGPEVAKAA